MFPLEIETWIDSCLIGLSYIQRYLSVVWTLVSGAWNMWGNTQKKCFSRSLLTYNEWIIVRVILNRCFTAGLTPQHRRDAWMNMDAHSRITAVLQASLDCTPVSAAPSTPASSAEGCPWSYIPPVSPRTCRGSDTYDRWLSAVMWMYYVSVSLCLICFLSDF